MKMDYTREEKLKIYSNRKVESGLIWVLFLLFGWSYGSLGQFGKQIFFYLTLGGLGLWVIYVLFTLNSKIRKYNKKIATEVGLNSEDLIMLGLL